MELSDTFFKIIHVNHIETNDMGQIRRKFADANTIFMKKHV